MYNQLMSWAARRRFLYTAGIALFFLIAIGGPIAYKIATIPPTCHDGIQNQGETAVDRGGPCLLLDDRYLQPHAVLWARSFQVRDGSYNAVAYIENPNPNAGVPSADYKFSLYDSQNILIAERTGTTYIMPGGITPVFTAGIDTGNRIAAHTYFTLTDSALTWERMSNPTSVISVASKFVSNADTEPQLSAIAGNSSVADLTDVSFVGVVFDTAGNAINASATILPRLAGGSQTQIGFTWPNPFTAAVGTIDVIPLLPPIPDPAAQR
jgi:hypothetical protein